VPYRDAHSQSEFQIAGCSTDLLGFGRKKYKGTHRLQQYLNEMSYMMTLSVAKFI
jgi:hypothetical protein